MLDISKILLELGGNISSYFFNFTNLGSLLTSLALRERSRGDLLARFGRLSLRKEDISEGLKPKSLL